MTDKELIQHVSSIRNPVKLLEIVRDYGYMFGDGYYGDIAEAIYKQIDIVLEEQERSEQA